MLLPIGRRLSHLAICFLLLLISTTSFAQKFAGTGCSNCTGGDEDRMMLDDLAVDAFKNLIFLENQRQRENKDVSVYDLRTGARKKISIKDLSTALTTSIDQHEMIVHNTANDGDQCRFDKDGITLIDGVTHQEHHVSDESTCPLKDNTGTSVEFLSDVDTQQMSVDVGRLARHKHDPQHLRRQMIHEAFRLSRLDDWVYQSSRQLEKIVETTECGCKTPDQIDQLLDTVGAVMIDPSINGQTTSQANLQKILNSGKPYSLGDSERVVQLDGDDLKLDGLSPCALGIYKEFTPGPGFDGARWIDVDHTQIAAMAICQRISKDLVPIATPQESSSLSTHKCYMPLENFSLTSSTPSASLITSLKCGRKGTQ